jgi:hypothetical protein
MKLRSSNRSWLKVAALCGLGLAATVGTFRVQADQWDKKTILTVDQPIQIKDTYLDPGTYVLKLANSSNDRHIVYIFNASQNHLINTILAVPNYRIRPTGNTQFVFWETPPGTARAMRAWFYPGDDYGQEFPYPNNLRQIAAVTPPPPPPPPLVAAPEPAPPAPVAAAPAPATEPEAVNQAPPPPETAPQEPVEIAQNTPPPPPAPEAAPPPPAEPPQELPKTATPYPLAGLGGLLSLGLYALVRVKRTA